MRSFRPPDQVAAEPEGRRRRYGVPPEVGYFAVEGDAIVQAIIGGRPALPFG